MPLSALSSFSQKSLCLLSVHFASYYNQQIHQSKHFLDFFIRFVLEIQVSLKSCNFYYLFFMTLQFRQKIQDTQFEQIQKENKLLREYNITLQKENNSRNEERKILQAEIDRLLERQRQFSKKSNSTVGITQSSEYISLQNQCNLYQQRYIELQSQYAKVVAQNSSLLFKAQAYDPSKIDESVFLREKETLTSTIRSLQVKIYTLEAQVFTYQSEINDLKIFGSNSKKINENVQQYQQRINQLQKQLTLKSLQITDCQSLYTKKQQEQNRQKLFLRAIIEELQNKLKQRIDQSTINLNQKQDSYLKQIMSLQFKNEESLRQLSVKQQQISKLKYQLTEKANIVVRNQELSKQILFQQEEINRLKRQNLQKSGLFSKIEDLIKQINLKDQQITKLKFELSEKNTIYTKNQELLLKIAIKQEEILRIKTQITQKTLISSKYQQLIVQQSLKQQQVSRLKAQISQKNTMFSIQVSQFQQRIRQFQTAIKAKDQQLSKQRAQFIQKQEQLLRVNKNTSSYLNKINTLSDQLDKLEKMHLSHAPAIKYGETEEANLLKSKLEQLNAINNNLSNKIEHSNSIHLSLTSTISMLEKQNHQRISHIKDLQRRVSILQDTNMNLENELRAAIQSRKTSSTLKTSQNEQSLKNLIKSMKFQLQQLKSSYQLLKLQNNQLYSQLQISRTQTHQCHHSRNHHHQNKSRSKSPHTKKIDAKYNKMNQVTFHPGKYDTMPNNKYEIFTNPVSHLSDNRRLEMISPLNSEMYKSSTQIMSSSGNDRFGELQKRIKMLQSQNQALRNHLV